MLDGLRRAAAGGLAALVVAALPVTGRAGESLKGSWYVNAALRDGRPAPEMFGHVLTFEANAFRIEDGGREVAAGTYRLDETVRPHAITFEVVRGEVVRGEVVRGAAGAGEWLGIVANDGDEVTLCDNAADPSQPRPRSFRVCDDPGYVMLTIRRVGT